MGAGASGRKPCDVHCRMTSHRFKASAACSSGMNETWHSVETLLTRSAICSAWAIFGGYCDCADAVPCAIDCWCLGGTSSAWKEHSWWQWLKANGMSERPVHSNAVGRIAVCMAGVDNDGVYSVCGSGFELSDGIVECEHFIFVWNGHITSGITRCNHSSYTR